MEDTRSLLNMPDFRWAVWLSDKTQIIEGSDGWGIIPGEKLPWARLSEYCINKNLYIEQLAVIVNDQVFYSPSSQGNFSFGIQPDFYSIQTIVEIENNFNESIQKIFVDVGTYFEDFSIHGIIDVTNYKNIWTQIRKGYSPLVKIPAK